MMGRAAATQHSTAQHSTAQRSVFSRPQLQRLTSCPSSTFFSQATRRATVTAACGCERMERTSLKRARAGTLCKGRRACSSSNPSPHSCLPQLWHLPPQSFVLGTDVPNCQARLTTHNPQLTTRRGCVTPIMLPSASPASSSIWEIWVVLPLPVSPAGQHLHAQL